MPEQRPSTALRVATINRAGHRCEYCRCPQAFAPDSFEVDHVIPIVAGGRTEFSNLAFACGGCNGFKHLHVAGRDPVDGALVPLFNPRSDVWDNHFVWNHDGSVLLGQTASGRATVERLRMNRASLVNLRLLLVSVGLHPPGE